MPAVLSQSERDAFHALLGKHNRNEDDFYLHEGQLRSEADGSVRGYLWVIHTPTNQGLMYDLTRLGAKWLNAFEQDLHRGSFPAARG